VIVQRITKSLWCKSGIKHITRQSFWRRVYVESQKRFPPNTSLQKKQEPSQ